MANNMWSGRVMRWGAVVGVAGAVLAVSANLKEITEFFLPDRTAQAVEETRAGVEVTQDKLDELLRLMREEAALAGAALNPAAETAIEDALRTILASGDARKAAARAALNGGDVDAAAASLADVADAQGAASEEARRAAAENWREVGALYAVTNLADAAAALRKAKALAPDDPSVRYDLASVLMRAGDFDGAEAECLHLKNDPALEPIWAARAAAFLSQIVRERGDPAAAKAHAEEALAAAESLGDDALAARAHERLGTIAREAGALDAAWDHYAEARDLHVAAGADFDAAAATGNLGLIDFARGDIDAARGKIESAVAAARAVNDPSREATWVGNLGAFLLQTGDLDGAEAQIRRSIEIGERLGLSQSVAYDLSNLGHIATERGDFAAAEQHLMRSLDIVRDTGIGALEPIVLANLGEVASQRGDTAAACGHWREARALMAAAESPYLELVDGWRADAGCDPL